MFTYDLDFLARRGSVETYVEIMTAVKDDGFRLTPDFKNKFNHFYRIINPDVKWQDRFYDLFADLKKGSNYCFRCVLWELSGESQQVYPSFASKLLHTFNPKLPIWDSFILKSLGLEMKGKSKNLNGKIEECCRIYQNICDAFTSHLGDAGVLKAIEEFNKRFPKYAGNISDAKKLDFILWSNRTHKFASVLELSKLQDDLDI